MTTTGHGAGGVSRTVFLHFSRYSFEVSYLVEWLPAVPTCQETWLDRVPVEEVGIAMTIV